MEINIIVAHSKNRVIGKGGDIPWHLPADQRNLKNLTSGEGRGICVGRKTYESFKKRDGTVGPLPNRVNIILTNDKDYDAQGKNDQTYICHSLGDAVKLAEKLGLKELYILGGGQVYEQAMDQNDFPISRLIVTEVDAEIDGDTFFPEIEPWFWRFEKEEYFKKDEKNSHDFKITYYEGESV